MLIRGRGIAKGTGSGEILRSPSPISFLSGVDPATGIIVEKGHPLEGLPVTGRVLVFPYGKGSTVGSYVLYALSRGGYGPAAMIAADAEPIIAVGAIISGIPLVDHPEIPISRMKNGILTTVDGGTGEIQYEGELLE